MSELHCIVVTPEATVVDVQASFVALPLFDGEIGILPGHAPMIGRMGHGEMRVRDKTGTRSFYVDGGFVQVADGTVSVLTNRALTPTALDPAEAKALLDKAAMMTPNNPEMMVLRDRLARARNQYADLGVLVRGDGLGPYQNVAAVLNACTQAGIRDLNLSVQIKPPDQ